MPRLMKRQDRGWRDVPASRYRLEKLRFWEDELGEQFMQKLSRI